MKCFILNIIFQLSFHIYAEEEISMNVFPRVSLRGLHQENTLSKLVKARGLYTWYTETL